MNLRKVVFWDFDGTLAYRPRGWSGTMLDLLVEVDPTTTLTRDDFVPLVSEGFPWHTPEVPHPELFTGDLWWQTIERIIARAYITIGLDRETAHALARQFRSQYLDLAGWVVYDDVIPTLATLAERGWRNVVVSNHVPELPELIVALGFGPLIERVITSALVAYEKPHAEMFRIALELAGAPKLCWMVGDNPEVDVLGAEKAGIKGILIRGSDIRIARSCASLYGVIDIIDALERNDDDFSAR